MSILNRQVLYSTKGDQFKFLDWAITTTTLGAMVEPFSINQRESGDKIIDFDPSDMMVKVNTLMPCEDEDDAKRKLSFGETTELHGGNALPRVFIFTGNS